ncbi:MAG: hypothetical protein GXZ06_04975 [Tissierellia bacterium]|nr:hypothetical protein [Tissierellia bacterium]
MNKFITIDMLNIYSIAVVVTVTLTEFFKDIADHVIYKLFKRELPTKYFVFFIALLIIFIPIIHDKKLSFESFFTGIINAVFLTLASMKSYETVIERAEDKKKQKKIIADNEKQGQEEESIME